MNRIHRNDLVRCRFWAACGSQMCDHHDVHHAHSGCYILQTVKYCCIVGGFVHDVSVSELDSNYECDPNLVFKAKRDARRKENSYKRIMLNVHEGVFGERDRW